MKPILKRYQQKFKIYNENLVFGRGTEIEILNLKSEWRHLLELQLDPRVLSRFLRKTSRACEISSGELDSSTSRPVDTSHHGRTHPASTVGKRSGSNMSNLYEANNQWSTRPDDERFSSLQEMFEATKAYANTAKTQLAHLDSLRVEVDKSNLHLAGASGAHAKLTNYSFGQISRLCGAPAEYLRKLPATLAAQNINHGLKRLADEKAGDKLNLLLHQNGSLVARAITSDSYDRVWNYEVLEQVMRRTNGTAWRVPPARPARPGQAGTRKATAADILPNQGDFGLAIKVGDDIAPAGLYASDHDMFAFLVKQGEVVQDGQQALNHGIFIQNSEVGDCSLRFKMFVYDNVCGNHIVWGVSQVTEVSVRHVKSESRVRGNTLRTAMQKWGAISSSQAKISEMEATIRKARAMVLGSSKDDALAAAFGFGRSNGLNLLTKGTLEAAYGLCEKSPRYGAPTTVWGLTNGLTELSQMGYTDQRTELDVQAGRLMEMVG